MSITTQVSFRNLAPSPSLEELIRERADKLSSHFPDIISCRVLVDVPHRRHRSGNPYHVRIELSVPGEDVVVTHEPSAHNDLVANEVVEVTKSADMPSEHRDAAVAVREAFDAARKRLTEATERRRGHVKNHSNRS